MSMNSYLNRGQFNVSEKPYSSYAQVQARLSLVSKVILISVLDDMTILASKEPRSS
jgi:hypothetical protein